MHYINKSIKLSLILLASGLLSGCNEREERQVRYVTIYLSQDVEIKETLVDLDMKKPGVVVVHPEGVEVKHHPTKPRKSVSFSPLPTSIMLLSTLSVFLFFGKMACFYCSMHRLRLKSC